LIILCALLSEIIPTLHNRVAVVKSAEETEVDWGKLKRVNADGTEIDDDQDGSLNLKNVAVDSEITLDLAARTEYEMVCNKNTN